MQLLWEDENYAAIPRNVLYGILSSHEMHNLTGTKYRKLEKVPVSNGYLHKVQINTYECTEWGLTELKSILIIEYTSQKAMIRFEVSS